MRHADSPNRPITPQGNETGAAAVEFAILLPLLVLIFTGMVEYGRLMWNYDVLAKATRDAARFLSAEKPVPAALATAQSMAANAATAAGVKNDTNPNAPFDPNDVIITCTPDCTSPNTVTVRISYGFTIGGWVPVISPQSGATFNNVTLSPHTTMPYMR